MATYDSLRSLPLHIDGYYLEPLEREVARDFTLRRTVIVLHGRGEEGRGEEVDYDPAQQARFQEQGGQMPLAGEHTIESFSLLQSGQTEYRRWALESAALDLALRQAGLSLGEAIGRTPQPLRFVVSTRVASVPRWLELYPELRFKLDPTTDWTDEIVATLAATGRVETVDFKGIFRGEFGAPPDAELYRRIVAAFPEAWIEDPALTPATSAVARRASRPHHVGRGDPRVDRRRGIAVRAARAQLQTVTVRLGEAALRLLRRVRGAQDRALRRRPVRARAGTRADPAARLALPSRRAERRRPGRLQRDRAGRRPARFTAGDRAGARLPPLAEGQGFRGETVDGAVAGCADRMPRRASTGLAATDQQIADVEMEVRRLSGPVRDLVDVHVERARRGRMQVDVEGGLLASLADRCRLERVVCWLDMTARLQQPTELRVRDETGMNASFVDHVCRGGEVRGRLVTRHRVGELMSKSKHGTAVRLLPSVGGDVRLQQP